MRARNGGLKRAIVYFESDAAGIVEGDHVLDGDRPVGMVHSGAVTPTVGRFSGFSLVSPPHNVGDTLSLSVRTSAGTEPIRVTRKGLYDPDDERLRASPRLAPTREIGSRMKSSTFTQSAEEP